MQFLEDAPVIIIGAGLAGLTTAWRLRQDGREVIVLEAADRIGGRAVQSARVWDDGQYAELGGELIDSAYHAVRALCAELDVELLEPNIYGERHDGDESLMEGYLRVAGFVLGDRVLSRTECDEIGVELRSAAQAHRPHPGEIVEQWIRRARLSEPAAGVTRALARLLTQLDPWDCDTHFVFGAQDGTFQRIRGGTQGLFLALADGVDVRLNDPVVRVERDRLVRVTTTSGQKLVGSAVVCAVGPYAISTIGFDPPLSDERVMTATSLLPAMGGKVMAQYVEGDLVREAFGSLVCTDGVINAAWVTAPSAAGTPEIVTSFFAGTERGLLADPEAAYARLDALVADVVGSPVTRVHGEVKNWWAEPLHLGVTVAPAEGTRAEVAGILGGEELVTHFAGDYTDAPMSGTLEGAVRSGLRAANEVLRKSDAVHTDHVTERLSI
ncbi:flavin monoamine oxidase family protein [Aeromicrobium sp. CTD01-1L150]|uniref:flavin monoamine oxidase family protein n=1 Tax=Aeromicrobium sp. CTD01-1L150 TaxID=3341830 RepID=UPI0035C14702